MLKALMTNQCRIIAGKKHYIKNIHLQNRGIGRHMKFGNKEFQVLLVL